MSVVQAPSPIMELGPVICAPQANLHRLTRRQVPALNVPRVRTATETAPIDAPHALLGNLPVIAEQIQLKRADIFALQENFRPRGWSPATSVPETRPRVELARLTASLALQVVSRQGKQEQDSLMCFHGYAWTQWISIESMDLLLFY